MISVTVILGNRGDSWVKTLYNPVDNMTRLQLRLMRIATHEWVDTINRDMTYPKSFHRAVLERKALTHEWALQLFVLAEYKRPSADLLETLTNIAAQGIHVEIVNAQGPRIIA